MSTANDTESAPAKTNGILKNGQPKEKNVKNEEADKLATDVAEAGAGVKLTGAELKKQKAAERAARRAEKVAEKGSQAMQSQPGPSTNSTASTSGRQEPGHQTPNNKGNERPRRESMAGAAGGARQLPLRPGQPASKETAVAPAEKKLDKRVPMLSHLYTASAIKKVSLASAGREIHPSVLTLGLQLRDYVICGSNARTVATLLVFKKVIRAYSTPAGVALSRHLTTHLSHQISYLSHARPLNVSQGNSIRWLKKLISALDPDLAESEAKNFLCTAIDSFIREKITLADEVIAKEAAARLEDEDEVILTYGKSSVVEKTLLTAWKAGKKFRVIVVDSRPLFEGKNLARSLIRAGLPDVKYSLLSGLADVVEKESITKCLLGASAMLGNGTLSSRAGTAMVAMMAKDGGNGGAQGRGKVPVIVLCETVKFTARITLDSLAMNEIGDPDLLVERAEQQILSQGPAPSAALPATGTTISNQPSKGEGSKKGGKPGKPGKEEDEEEKKELRGLEGWRDQPNLFLVNLMYDVTPVEYLDMVVSELGSLPASAVPVVNGVDGGDE